MRGLLIALEGGEGVGKSTQATILAKRLGAVVTREPGGTRVGERLRALLLHPTTATTLHPRTEALLMAADRAQHVAEVIGPELAAGRHVVTDRWIGSSVAYQGWGRGLEGVEALSGFATEDLDADLVVYLSLTPEQRRARVEGRVPDHFEAEAEVFHDRVTLGFTALAGARDNWVTVDGAGSVEEVAGRIWAEVSSVLAIRAREEELTSATFWGSDCLECGNATPGSMACELCQREDTTVALWVHGPYTSEAWAWQAARNVDQAPPKVSELSLGARVRH
jgi:dTMP kinase